MATIKHEITMTHERDTKGTHVYEADSTVVKQLYIGKGSFEKAPEQLKVTVEAIDGKAK